MDTSPDPNDPVARALRANPDVPEIRRTTVPPPPHPDEIESMLDWLLVRSKMLVDQSKPDSQIILPEGVSALDESQTLVEVLKIGPGRYSVQHNVHEPMPFEPGDRVYISGRGACTQDGWDSAGLMLVPAREVLCKRVALDGAALPEPLEVLEQLDELPETEAPAETFIVKTSAG